MKTDNNDNTTACTNIECGGMEEEISSNKKECTSCEQKNHVGASCKLLHDISISEVGSTSICANCGKEGSNVTNSCNKCKMVKYCNAACKKKHRHKHKKACERRVAELHDEKIFKQPPPEEDCPICFLRLPSKISGSTYFPCCGKVICNGCSYAIDVDEQLCAFCRTPAPKNEEEMIERIKKRVDLGDPEAIFDTGNCYARGINGYPQDRDKALELYHQAGELGNSSAYCNIGFAYDVGRGVEVDRKKAKYYNELAAMQGHAMARHNLGCMEHNVGNIERSIKHHMIAVGSGYNNSLKKIKELYTEGNATKDDYMAALQAYQTYLGEIRSVQRDKAAADGDQEYWWR